MRSRSILFLAGGLAACTPSGVETPKAEAPKAAMSSPARWTAVRSTQAGPIMELPARVVADPRGAAEVTAMNSGRVQRVLVQPGDPVLAGAPVVELAVPELSHAVAQLGAARKQLELLRARRGALAQLRKQGLARQSQVFELEARVAELEASEALALAQIRASGLSAADRRTLASTGRLALNSPVEGVVTDVHVHLGQTVNPDGPPLVQVQGQGSSRVEVQLPGHLPEGARLELVGFDGQRHALEPSAKASVVDPETGTLRAWFELTEARLPSGLRGSVEVLADALDWSDVPARAVVSRGAGPAVYRRRGETTAWTPVKLHARSGASAIVQGDLQEGDEVLADGRAAPEEAAVSTP